MHAVGAEHVRDLVRVGDDRGRPERQHEPRELVDEQLRRLEVHVRVDEARHDVAAGRVELSSPVVVAEPGDEAVDDRDVAVEPLAREDGEHLAAAHDEVGGLVAARDREPTREIGSRRPIGRRNRTVPPWTCSRPRTLDEALRLQGGASRRAARSRAAPT